MQSRLSNSRSRPEVIPLADATPKRTTGQKYRLYPTDEQAAQMGQVIGACRALYNAALEQRIAAYRMSGVTLNSFSQNAGLTELLHADGLEWVGQNASRESLKIALRDLDSAYSRFFKGLGGFPKFKRRGRGESFSCSAGVYGYRRVNRRWSEIRIPKIGWVRVRRHVPIRGRMKTATVSRDDVGWHVSFTVELIGPAPKRPAPNPVGIDRGVANTVALSTGQMLSQPKTPEGEARRLLRLERKLARQTKGSARREQTKRAITKIRGRQRRRRQSWAHQVTTQIARTHDVVVLEDLRVPNMTRSAKGTLAEPGTNVRAKSGLNRSILEQGWGELQRQLAYKMEWHGSQLIVVNPAYSSQSCAKCGHVAAQNRESQSVFSCEKCGHLAHADTNAARVILSRGLPKPTGAQFALAARGGDGTGRPAKREGRRGRPSIMAATSVAADSA